MTVSKVKKIFLESKELLEDLLGNLEFLEKVDVIYKLCHDALEDSRTIFFAGNGGSAAEAQHMAGEYICKFKKDRRGFAAIALTTDSSNITSIANDYGYKYIFSRQIESLCRADDLVFLYSTSGNSPNIIEAAIQAKKNKAIVIGMTGKKGGELSKHTDYLIKIPSDSTPRIQEMHTITGHIICELVESKIVN